MAKVVIGIRSITRNGVVHIIKTKKKVTRDIVARYDDGCIKDSAGEKWRVKPIGNGNFLAVS